MHIGHLRLQSVTKSRSTLGGNSGTGSGARLSGVLSEALIGSVCASIMTLSTPPAIIKQEFTRRTHSRNDINPTVRQCRGQAGGVHGVLRPVSDLSNSVNAAAS